MSATIFTSNRFLWDFDSVLIEASNYNNKTEFKKNSRGAFNWALRNNCLSDICKNMTDCLTIWSFELCKAEALKYSSRTEYQLQSKSSYSWARKNNCLDKVCRHMESPIYGFDPSKPAILYYLQVNGGLFKIGITNRSIRERFGSDMKYIKVIAEVHFLSGSDAASAERHILNKYKEFKYFGQHVLRSGNTELFVCDVLNII